MATVTIDRTTQRFASSPQPEPDVVVEHTTEVMGWPNYADGGQAPHATIWPLPGVGIKVREHIPWTQNAKALMNLPGGVETNRRGVIQFELVGTCDPSHRGDPRWYFWPDADDVVLEALADYQRPIMAQFAIPFEAPPFQAYSGSYGPRGGTNTVRMTNAQWLAFQGICGHQHVPENVHGDPGAFPIDRFLAFLRGTTQKDWFDMASIDDLKAATASGVLGAKVGNTGLTVGVILDRLYASAVAANARDVAQTAAITALAQNQGADPEVIKAAVDDALSAYKLTLTKEA